jgi:hypothetical protein
VARIKTSAQQTATGTKATTLQAMPPANAIVIGTNDREAENVVSKPFIVESNFPSLYIC